MSEPIISVDGLSVRFPVGRSGFWGGKQRLLHAVDGVSFDVARGEVLGLVGESGSGKSTTGRAILRRVDASEGTIRFKGEDITHKTGEEVRRLRRHMQLVFQDPYGSLNPRQSVLEIVAEPLLVHGMIDRISDARDQVVEFLDLVGMPPDAVDRHPHAFSGGQRQRIGIARALALRPDFIVADEPVSALDVSIQAQIVNLMQELKDELGLTYLFIAHDLSVVRHISNRIAIMYAGRLVEIADRDAVYETPMHPYTKALLSAVPIPDPAVEKQRQRIVVQGEIPDPVDPPPGCRFASRCAYRQDRCVEESPELRDVDGQQVACHFAEQIAAGDLVAR
ncbi:MAG: ATP-binding cassette domain-containing protein [Acidimicrobiia bacterium]|nr:ATP-binding cassette domain-containing protein [Acidimicrobiia bacterium]MDH4308218.1 ATP-binding cassette domain-containing protein [Acidimicrobiia bacterium]MDH5294417.1 ATP-binding cassette domain-containing protein [Acidimicrobiia bacterium]